MYYVLMLTAMLMVGLELFSSLRNQRTHYSDATGVPWQRVYRWRWLLGAVLAGLSLLMGYHGLRRRGAL